MSTNKLHNIKDTGYKVPEDYFTSFEDTILSEVKLRTSISQSGFEVPDTYFELLEDKISLAVKPEQETKVIKLVTWRKASYAAAVAASLVLMVNIFFYKPINVTINVLETASIENYIINEEIETAEFASLFTQTDLQNVQLINDGFTSENLEKYLFENLEIEDIITK